MKLKIIPYTPSEAAVATGRTVENQRNDRRAGYTPEQKGHARYDLIGLCRLFCIEAFAARGVGPMKSVRFADAVAEEIALHLMVDPRAWTAAALETARSPEFDEVTAQALEQHVNMDWVRLNDQAQAVAMAVDPGILKRLCIARGIVVWADDSFDISDGFWRRYGELSFYDPKGAGVVSMLHFKPAAAVLAAKLPRPILDIEQ